MAKDGSVAPQERVNITYKASTGDAQEEVELPLKLLFMGDYTNRPDSRPLEERKPISVDKDNFQKVLGEQNLGVTMSVADKLSDKSDANINVSLKFKSLADFSPEGVATQVPEVQKLLQLRQALTALKGPLGNVPAFRKKIQALLGDDAARSRLMTELGLDKGEG